VIAANSSAFGLRQPHLERTRLCELADAELDGRYVRQRGDLRAALAALVKPKVIRGKVGALCLARGSAGMRRPAGVPTGIACGGLLSCTDAMQTLWRPPDLHRRDADQLSCGWCWLAGRGEVAVSSGKAVLAESCVRAQPQYRQAQSAQRFGAGRSRRWQARPLPGLAPGEPCGGEPGGAAGAGADRAGAGDPN
jgi:hypothetical protein